MFGFFKRTRIETWEIDLLRNVIQLLPSEYRQLENQINEGLLRRVLIGMSDLPGYVAFTYNSKLIRKFENKNNEDYKLTGIKVWDTQSKHYLLFSIFVSTGTISGYAIESYTKFSVDPNVIDVDSFKKEYITTDDYKKIQPHLNTAEEQAINPAEVYEIKLNGKSYFHIKDMEDGDFIGMDIERNVYKVTHDPFDVKLLNCTLIEALNKKV